MPKIGNKSQNETILDHLLRGKSITPSEASKLYDCSRLSARIYDIRHHYDYPVKSKNIVKSNGEIIMKYWIEPPVQLNLPFWQKSERSN